VFVLAGHAGAAVVLAGSEGVEVLVAGVDGDHHVWHVHAVVGHLVGQWWGLHGVSVRAQCDKVGAHGPTLKWTVVGDMPTSGTWLLSTTVVGGEDGPIHQFGVKFLDGKLIAVFVFDHVAGSQFNFGQVTPQRVGDTWTVIFPTADLGVAASGRWSATLNLDGDDTEVAEGALWPVNVAFQVAPDWPGSAFRTGK
jgi:hypothetical protein